MVAGLKSEVGYRERENHKLLQQIQQTVKMEMMRQNKRHYAGLEPPVWDNQQAKGAVVEEDGGELSGIFYGSDLD